MTALWANYRQLGYPRLIYTNTLSVLPSTTGMFQRAMGADVRIVRVLLTADDTTAAQRLASREIGSELEETLMSNTHRAGLLAEQVSPDTLRIVTDQRTDHGDRSRRRSCHRLVQVATLGRRGDGPRLCTRSSLHGR